MDIGDTQKSDTKIHKTRFKYNKDLDCYICPETGIILPYTGRIDRQGYKLYSSKENCCGCIDIRRCCAKKQGYRVIRRHIREDLNENFRNNRISAERQRIV